MIDEFKGRTPLECEIIERLSRYIFDLLEGGDPDGVCVYLQNLGIMNEDGYLTHDDE